MRQIILGLLVILPTMSAQEAIDIGSRRELFVDRHLVERLDGARLELGMLRDEGCVLRFDRPWEGPFCAYATVIRDGDRFLMFYRGLPRADLVDGSAARTCIALSSDGREWKRPTIGRFEVDGSSDNNVILADAAPVTHNFSPFLDARPGVEPEQRFKALGGNERSGLIPYVSKDGLRWSRLRAEPVITQGMFDSQNVAFWSASEGCYVCYFRTWSEGGYRGFRTVSRTTSKDFLSWTEPVSMTFGDTPREHLYTNQTHPYFRAPHLYVGIAARFMPGRQVVSAEEAKRLGVEPNYFRDCSDAVLLTSRGGARYDRTFMEGFVRPDIGLENWVSRSNYPALNLVQTGATEMSLYVTHDYAQPTAHLRRYSLRLDGLASVRAPYAGGELITRPLRFAGSHLELNFATSAAGGVRVELLDVDGKPIKGFTRDDAVEQIGNDVARIVSWRRGTDVSKLTGRIIRMRLILRDADVWSFRFAAP